MKELFELIKMDIKDVLLRFGIVTELKQTDRGFTSEPINMQPRMFEEVWLVGEINESYDDDYFDGYDEDKFVVSIKYRYRTFDGGENSTGICHIAYYIRKGYEDVMARNNNKTDNIKYLYQRAYVTLPYFKK